MSSPPATSAGTSEVKELPKQTRVESEKTENHSSISDAEDALEVEEQQQPAKRVKKQGKE